MYDVDLDKFWADDEIAHKDNCFCKDATQVAMGIRMSDECVFAELGVDGQPWGETPREDRIRFNKAYNEIALKVVGRKLLSEDFLTPEMTFPKIKEIGEVFGGEYIYNGITTWLERCFYDEKSLETKLDELEQKSTGDLKDIILPANWESEKNRIFNDYGRKPPIRRGVRGPVTLASSLFGTEDILFLFYDNPELFTRFSQVIQKVIIAYIDIFDEEAGYTKDNAPSGFGFFDDDCNLCTPEMYEAFGYPVLKAVFEKCSPNENDRRYQHSDSSMAHLLHFFGDLKLNGCNFGPTLTVDQIRKAIPNCRIDGQLAPFTFMNNNPDEIIAEVKRDCAMAINGNYRGLNIATAGSINNGSSLQSMRVVMHAIQKYGQYR